MVLAMKCHLGNVNDKGAQRHGRIWTRHEVRRVRAQAQCAWIEAEKRSYFFCAATETMPRAVLRCGWDMKRGHLVVVVGWHDEVTLDIVEPMPRPYGEPPQLSAHARLRG